MSNYLFIESRDPFKCRDCQWLYETAKSISTSGNSVTFFLIQNGVFPARAGSVYARHLAMLYTANIKLLADHLSLEERSITESQLIDEVECVSIDVLADLLAGPDVKAVWH